MPTVADVRAAVKKLSVKQRTDLLVQLAEDKAVQKEQLARVRAAVQDGVRDHEEGRFTEIKTTAEHRAFFDEIKKRGRSRIRKSA
jgi:acyl-CoA reductase-like NAD-dependent aldehyde dehydrogenase